MNTFMLHNNTLGTLSYPERRQSYRFTVNHILTVTNRGVGRVITINRHGFSFGCLYPHTFNGLLHLDLLDAAGNHLKQLPVRIVWQKRTWEEGSEFELLVGAEFQNLSPGQSKALENLLADFECFEM